MYSHDRKNVSKNQWALQPSQTIVMAIINYAKVDRLNTFQGPKVEMETRVKKLAK